MAKDVIEYYLKYEKIKRSDFNKEDYVKLDEEEARLPTRMVSLRRFYRGKKGEFTTYYLTKEDFEEFVEVSYEKCKIASLVGFYFIHVSGRHYVLKSQLDDLNHLKDDHQAYTVEGSLHPYYFKVNGQKLWSKTPDWNKFLLDSLGDHYYHLILMSSLEESDR